MTALANVTIVEARFDREGEKEKDGKTYTWKLYKFKVDKSDLEFGYFASGNKTIPAVGMELEVLQWDVTHSKDGKYTNNTVSKLMIAGLPTPQANPTPTPPQGRKRHHGPLSPLLGHPTMGMVMKYWAKRSGCTLVLKQ